MPNATLRANARTTTKLSQPADDQLAKVSFFAIRDGKILAKPTASPLPRCFWNVRSTGDYGTDCRTGENLALEYLELQERGDSGSYLQLIVADMPRKLTGVEVGFLTVVAHSAAAGANEGRRLVRYWSESAVEQEA
jgi:hypothetical protein